MRETQGPVVFRAKTPVLCLSCAQYVAHTIAPGRSRRVLRGWVDSNQPDATK
jgi:hypothetical protein